MFQGGPGSSSTGFGNFVEIGPLDVGLQPRNSTWVIFSFIYYVLLYSYNKWLNFVSHTILHWHGLFLLAFFSVMFVTHETVNAINLKLFLRTIPKKLPTTQYPIPNIIGSCRYQYPMPIPISASCHVSCSVSYSWYNITTG